MINKRLWTAVGLLIGALLAIAAIVYYLVFHDFNNAAPTAEEVLPPAKQTVLTPQTSTSTAKDRPTPIAPADAEEQQTAGAVTVAKNFVERFGTYSSQSDDNVLDDLRFITTDKMQTWLKSQFAGRSKGDYTVYNGYTTRAVTVRVLSGGDNTAKTVVLVEAQRMADRDDGQTDVSAQKIKIDLLKQGGRWLVDGAYWQ